MKNWNVVRALAAGVMVCVGQLFAFADTDMTQAVPFPSSAENVAAEKADSIAETMGVQTDRGNRLNTEALDTETTAEAGNTEPSNPQQVTPAPAPFNYKDTKEWGRFVLLTGVGVVSTAITVAGTIYSTILISLNHRVSWPEVIAMGGTGLFLAGSVASFVFAHKNLKAAKQKSKAGQQVTAGFGVGTLAAPLGGNRTEVMPALSLSLSF